MSYLYLKMPMNTMAKIINNIICFVSFILISTFRRFHFTTSMLLRVKKSRERIKGENVNVVQRTTVAFDRGCHEHGRSLSSCLSLPTES